MWDFLAPWFFGVSIKYQVLSGFWFIIFKLILLCFLRKELRFHYSLVFISLFFTFLWVIRVQWWRWNFSVRKLSRILGFSNFFFLFLNDLWLFFWFDWLILLRHWASHSTVALAILALHILNFGQKLTFLVINIDWHFSDLILNLLLNWVYHNLGWLFLLFLQESLSALSPIAIWREIICLSHLNVARVYVLWVIVPLIC